MVILDSTRGVLPRLRLLSAESLHKAGLARCAKPDQHKLRFRNGVEGDRSPCVETRPVRADRCKIAATPCSATSWGGTINALPSTESSCRAVRLPMASGSDVNALLLTESSCRAVRLPMASGSDVNALLLT